MTFFFVFAGLAVLVIVSLLLSLWGAWRRRRMLPYTLQQSLFSAEELAFLVALDEAVGSDYRVFGKVRMSDLASARRGTDKHILARTAARLSGLVVEFLVCSRASSAVVCAVELVGKGSRSGRGRASSNSLARACDVLGLPLVRIPAAETYSAKALAEQIYNAIYVPKVTAPVDGPQGRRGDDGLSPAEEEQALSVLAAAIREGDALPRRRST